MFEYLDSLLLGFGFLFLIFWPFLLMLVGACLTDWLMDRWNARHGFRVGKLWHVLSVSILTCALILVFGCNKTTLAPDGAYAGNVWLYQIDQSAADAKASLGEFINWARANYPALHAQHRDDVLGAAESVRTNAPVWFKAASTARTIYTNALYTGASAATLNDTSNALFVIAGVIQSHAHSFSPLTNSLTP